LGMARPLLSLVLAAIWLGWPLLLLACGWPGLLPVIGVGVPFAASAWCLERALPRAAARPSDPPSAHDPSPHPPLPERTSCPPHRSPAAPFSPPPPSSPPLRLWPPAEATAAARRPPRRSRTPTRTSTPTACPSSRNR